MQTDSKAMHVIKYSFLTCNTKPVGSIDNYILLNFGNIINCKYVFTAQLQQSNQTDTTNIKDWGTGNYGDRDLISILNR